MYGVDIEDSNPNVPEVESDSSLDGSDTRPIDLAFRDRALRFAPVYATHDRGGPSDLAGAAIKILEREHRPRSGSEGERRDDQRREDDISRAERWHNAIVRMRCSTLDA